MFLTFGVCSREGRVYMYWAGTRSQNLPVGEG